MLPNDVEIEPIIIAPPSLTGYRNCAALTDLRVVWWSYPGRDMMMEVWRHMETCELCKANRLAQDAYRTALADYKAEPIPVEIPMEALNVPSLQ